MHFPYKQFFNFGIDLFVPIAGGLGMYTGINAFMYSRNYDSFCLLRNVITYTSIGILIGITYPISFPLIIVYTLYTA